MSKDFKEPYDGELGMEASAPTSELFNDVDKKKQGRLSAEFSDTDIFPRVFEFRKPANFESLSGEEADALRVEVMQFYGSAFEKMKENLRRSSADIWKEDTSKQLDLICRAAMKVAEDYRIFELVELAASVLRIVRHNLKIEEQEPTPEQQDVLFMLQTYRSILEDWIQDPTSYDEEVATTNRENIRSIRNQVSGKPYLDTIHDSRAYVEIFQLWKEDLILTDLFSELQHRDLLRSPVPVMVKDRLPADQMSEEPKGEHLSNGEVINRFLRHLKRR